MPARIWYIQGVITPGLNLYTGRKALKKSWLLQQAGDAIAEGFPWLGRRTLQAKVLWVSFELDDGDLHDRLNTAKHLSDNMDILYSWPSGDEGLELAERAITERGYRVIIFDTFLPLLPQDGLFKINEYGDTAILPEVAFARETAQGGDHWKLARGKDPTRGLHAGRHRQRWDERAGR